ncbi:uncharacterized protein LOC135470294 [Liolophura sinensis]|uniref:uncharacterized protein LOC135470294 n=1 Tax=Liolophura sinensis TaxID=3198878 RepID=UPI003158BFF2
MTSGTRSKGTNYMCIYVIIVVCVIQVSTALDKQTRERIDSFVQQVLECRNVPAMSMAVVGGSEPGDIYARGYGLADLEKNVTADSDTRFAVGSVTKAFTITLLASLLTDSKGQYSWDTPVRDIMGGDFRFADDERTRSATLRDLAAHKMGLYSYILPTIAGLDSSHTDMDYCRRMRYLEPYKSPREPTTQLRTKFIYSNAMYMLLGCVAEKMGGDTYGNLLHKHILEPLNMTSAMLFREVKNWTSPEFAMPYVFYNNSLTRLSTDVAGGLHPFDAAGSLLASGEDMVKWIRYHLGLSRVILADPSLIQQTYQPQFSMGSRSPNGVFKPNFPFSDEPFAYSMGWMTGMYRDFRYTSHNGLVSGYGSELRLYDNAKAGIYVDTSGPMYTDAYLARLATVWFISDLVLGMDPVLNASTACTFPQPFVPAPTPANTSNRFAGKVPLPVPERQAKRAVGQYGHPLFGNVTISKSPSNPQFLHLSFGRLVTSWLGSTPWADPRRPDLLGGTLRGKLWYFLETGPVPFRELGGILYVLFQGEHTSEEKFINLTLRLSINSLQAPITFQRDLMWDDVDLNPVKTPPDCTASAVKLVSSHVIFAISCISTILLRIFV